MTGLRTWKLWSGLVVLFLAGVFVGAMGMGLYEKHKFEKTVTNGPQAIKERIFSRLARELDLSKDQRGHLERTIDRAQSELLELRRRHQPQIEAIILKYIDSMKAHLTPDQQQKLDSLYREAKERWEHRAKQPFSANHEAPGQ